MSDVLLHVEHLTKSFGGLVAVRDVSLDVAAGEVLGVIGPNGAGKTTLFNCITGFDRPNHGSVRFRGRDIVGKRPYLIVKAGLARTFQIVRPFPDLPAIANVMVALTARGVGNVRDEAVAILGRVGLVHLATAPCRQLSEGDLKRLEMARALATNPSLLLLDEPFAGLSRDEIQTLSDAISSLRESGTALVIVEHKLRELLRLVDRVVVMDQGAVIADGSPQQVMRDPAVVQAYLGAGASSAGA